MTFSCTSALTRRGFVGWISTDTNSATLYKDESTQYEHEIQQDCNTREGYRKSHIQWWFLGIPSELRISREYGKRNTRNKRNTTYSRNRRSFLSSRCFSIHDLGKPLSKKERSIGMLDLVENASRYSWNQAFFWNQSKLNCSTDNGNKNRIKGLYPLFTERRSTTTLSMQVQSNDDYLLDRHIWWCQGNFWRNCIHSSIYICESVSEGTYYGIHLKQSEIDRML